MADIGTNNAIERVQGALRRGSMRDLALEDLRLVIGELIRVEGDNRLLRQKLALAYDSDAPAGP